MYTNKRWHSQTPIKHRSLVSQFPAQADSDFTVGLRSTDVYREGALKESRQRINTIRNKHRKGNKGQTGCEAPTGSVLSLSMFFALSFQIGHIYPVELLALSHFNKSG